MTLETTAWGVTEFLDGDAAIAACLDAVFEAGDPDEIRDALRHVARAKGMAALAEASGSPGRASTRRWARTAILRSPPWSRC